MKAQCKRSTGMTSVRPKPYKLATALWSDNEQGDMLIKKNNTSFIKHIVRYELAWVE